MDDSYSWDELHMTNVFLVASKSKDPRTHAGAVIVDQKNHPVSTGFNGLPRGVKDLPERYNNRALKKLYIEHAERNAIYAANESLEDCKLYTSFFPCTECARAIIQTGIKEVIIHKDFSDHEDLAHYNEDSEAGQAVLEMFDEAGVNLRKWSGKLIAISGKRAGKHIDL